MPQGAKGRAVSSRVDDAKRGARGRLREVQERLVRLSHQIHSSPEIAFEERNAAGWLTDFLSRSGFEVEPGICGLPTAFSARAGSGPAHVAFCAEYDALPGLGHACGHNLIAAISAGAGVAAARVADEAGLTVSVIGTPAEESGGGKIRLLEGKAFEGVDFAMMVHPAPFDVLTGPIIAATELEIAFEGREAHAASSPEAGINAGDALTIAQSAIGLLRQHLAPSDRIHGIITKGGDSPNVIPAHTAARYMVRARTREDLDRVRSRTIRCFQAGALATGCRMTLSKEPVVYAEMRSDVGLSLLYRKNAEALGRRFPDLGALLERAFVSSDMGNVSHVLPCIHPFIGIGSFPAVNHQPDFVAHCVGELADRAIADGALALAWTAIDRASQAALPS